MDTTTTTSSTTTPDPNIYRFEGFRYGLRAPDAYGPNDIIPEQPSLFAFPKGDDNNNNANDRGN
jgi:hypothetical protein